MNDDKTRLLGLHPLEEARRLGLAAEEILALFGEAAGSNVERLPIDIDRIRRRIHPAGEACVILPFRRPAPDAPE